MEYLSELGPVGNLNLLGWLFQAQEATFMAYVGRSCSTVQITRGHGACEGVRSVHMFCLGADVMKARASLPRSSKQYPKAGMGMHSR